MVRFYSCDFETHLISNEHPNPKPVCLSYYDGENPAEILIGGDIPRFLKKVLGKVPLIAHNMKFEMLVTYVWYPELRPQIWEAYDKGLLICTYLYERLIDNTRHKPLKQLDLASLVKHYFKTDISEGKKKPDAWRLRYSELENIPLAQWPKEAVEYSKQDSEWAYKIYLKQSLSVQNYKEHTFSDFTLNLMASYGMLVDIPRVKLLEKEVTELLKPSKDFLYSQGMYREEKGKLIRNMSVLISYIVQKVPNPIRTPKGTISTKGAHLVNYLMQIPSDPVLKAYQLIMEYQKVLTAYTVRLKEANPTIRTQYKPFIETGRTSSSGTPIYPSMNIQQQPRKIEGVTWDIRNCFIPRPGYKIVSIDYAGLELAATAHQLDGIVNTQHSHMLSAINKGDIPTDMHSLFATEIRNRSGKHPKCTYEEFVKNKKKETFKEFRQLAKPINLGFPGGIGYDTMSTLLFNEGIQLGLKVLKEIEVKYAFWRDHDGTLKPHPLLKELEKAVFLMRSQGKEDVRIKRVAWNKFQLVKDELVYLKKTLMDLYPDLKEFLTETHKEFIIPGKTQPVMRDYEEREEAVYAYDMFGVRRNWATYTAACNGILMQTPSAAGAKNAVNIIVRYCENNTTEIKPLAFIHDEILFEIKDNDNLVSNAIIMSEMMIDGMQQVLTKPRIAVEFDVMSWWSKSGTGGPSGTLWKNAGENKLYKL